MFPVVSCTMSGMSEEDRKRLGREVIARRTELGMTTTKGLAEKAKLSARMLGDVENGRRQNFSPGAKAQIEHALDWMYGTVDDILAGDPPTPIPDVRSDGRQEPLGIVMQVDLTAIPGDALVEELRRRLRSDFDYLSSKPVRRWTGLIEIIETKGDEDVVEATTEPDAPGEAVQAQEESAGPVGDQPDEHEPEADLADEANHGPSLRGIEAHLSSDGLGVEDSDDRRDKRG
jgi:transcriptional regulator with XRE-family HTH domain